MRRVIAGFVVMIAVAYGTYAYRSGPVFSADSMAYSRWADVLIATGFNVAAFAREATFVYSPLVYLGWLTVVAAAKLTAGPLWATAIVGLNVALVPVAAVMLLDLVRRMTGSVLAVGAAGILLLGAYDIFSWVPYVLSDFSFMVLVLLALYLLVRTSASPRARLAWMAAIVVSTAAALYRPSGAPVVALLAAAAATRRAAVHDDPARRARFARRAALVVSGLVVALLAAHTWIMADPSRWPLVGFAGWIDVLSRQQRAGIVVADRPETHHPPAASSPALLGVTLDKLRSFFAISADGFSPRHRQVNRAFFVPLYALALVGILRLFVADPARTPTAWWSGWLCLGMIISFAVFHALQQIDHDWRYRVPTLPPFILLASSGFHDLVLGWRRGSLAWAGQGGDDAGVRRHE